MEATHIYLLLTVLGFLIVAACLIYLVVALVKTLNSITLTFNSLESQIQNLDEEPRKLLTQANELSININDKMKCLDPLFHIASNIGERIEYRTEKYKNESLENYFSERVREKEETKIDQAMDVAVIILNLLELFQKIKKRREK